VLTRYEAEILRAAIPDVLGERGQGFDTKLRRVVAF